LDAISQLQRVTRDASALNMPLTAVTSTFLIQILKRQTDEPPIHQAALIECYIEMMLEKFAPRELLPGTFNFKNKLDLLSVVAERIVREEKFNITEQELLNWVMEYLNEYGLKYSPTNILNYFLSSRLLVREGEFVRFQLRMFFEFFVATRMREDKSFREFVFSDEMYLSFPHEISFYCALSLRDKPRLEKIFKAFRKIGDEVAKSRATLTPPLKSHNALFSLRTSEICGG
jgi:hypothetical protein